MAMRRSFARIPRATARVTSAVEPPPVVAMERGATDRSVGMREPHRTASPGRFEEAMLPHLDAAYTLARHLLRDPHDAEDAVQDAYLRALRHFAGFRGGDGKAWMLAIVRNVCYTMRRRRPRGVELEFDEAVHGETSADDAPDAGLLRSATRDAVMRAMERLPMELREALVLREVQELSYREIAAVMDIPVGTVMSRLSRARHRLALALREGGIG
jgi:RNA polymerase sigma-70 factor (ECF subfamily)